MPSKVPGVPLSRGVALICHRSLRGKGRERGQEGRQPSGAAAGHASTIWPFLAAGLQVHGLQVMAAGQQATILVASP